MTKSPSTPPATDKQKVKRRRLRCHSCNKKLTISSYACKCGNHYCFKHTAAHDCTFDHKAHNKRLLTEKMPVVQPCAVDKI